MATTSDILTLARAGFSRAEIAELLKDEQPAPAPEPQPEPAPQPEPQPAPTPAPAPAPAPAPDMLGQILGKFDEMSRSMQELAIKNSQQPKQETADDILAAIIRPPRKE